MRQEQIDSQVFELYDEYCHGQIDRREFFRRAGQITIAGASALAMAQALMPNYADAQETHVSSDLKLPRRNSTFAAVAATANRLPRHGVRVSTIAHGYSAAPVA